MKIKITFFILFVAFTFKTGFCQQVPSTNFPIQAISIKPVNFSNIDLSKEGDFPGYHAGLAYERLLRPESHWAFVFPLTVAYYNTLFVSDYDKKGYQLYVTPGVKYYLKANQPWRGWSASLNTIVGIDRYDYSGQLRSGNVATTFYGILGSWIFNAPMGKNTAFNFELGFGMKYAQLKNDYQRLQDFPPYHQIDKVEEYNFSGIMNISIGISKWF